MKKAAKKRKPKSKLDPRKEDRLPAASGQRHAGRGGGMPTAQQEIFIERYMTHGNSTRAAREAGYNRPSQRGAMLRNGAYHPLVAAELERRLAERRKEWGVEAFHLIRELSHSAFFSVKDLTDPKTGRMYELKDMPDEVCRAVSKITVTVGEEFDSDAKELVRVKRVTVETNNKLEAIKQLARLMGLDKTPSMDVTVKTEKTVSYDWDKLVSAGRETSDPGIEGRLDAERLKLAPRVVEAEGLDAQP